VVLQANGLRYAAGKVERMRRPDVMRHFGLSMDDCGFRATFDIQGISDAPGLGPGLQVLGGESPESANAPLRIASAVAVMLQDAS